VSLLVPCHALPLRRSHARLPPMQQRLPRGADVLDEYMEAEVSRWKQLTQVAVQPAAAPRPGRVAAAAAPLDPDEDTDLYTILLRVWWCTVTQLAAACCSSTSARARVTVGGNTA
jgi:hypothetical protein